jgi:hypothetical protein
MNRVGRVPREPIIEMFGGDVASTIVETNKDRENDGSRAQRAPDQRQDRCSVNSDARHQLRSSVACDAQVQKLPCPGRSDAVRAELRSNREIERKLRDNGGFLARASADDVESRSEFLNAELHGVVPSSLF